MLYIAVRRLEEEEPANQVLDIHVNIVDYSKAGLIEGSLKLYYREAGERNGTANRLGNNK